MISCDSGICGALRAGKGIIGADVVDMRPPPCELVVEIRLAPAFEAESSGAGSSSDTRGVRIKLFRDPDLPSGDSPAVSFAGGRGPFPSVESAREESGADGPLL